MQIPGCYAQAKENANCRLIILVLILLAGCAPAPAIEETPIILQATLPPRWTETPTLLIPATPTSTPTLTMTFTESAPSPAELTTPTETMPSISRGVRMTVRRPLIEETKKIESIWRGIKTTELTAPGENRYSTIVPADSLRLLDYYLCARKDNFPDYINAVDMSYWLEDIKIPNYILYITDRDGSPGWKCRYWATIVYKWPVDRTVLLEVRVVFNADVSDGRTVYPAGEYREVINVEAKQ